MLHDSPKPLYLEMDILLPDTRGEAAAAPLSQSAYTT